jgi:hypothetical protein
MCNLFDVVLTNSLPFSLFVVKRDPKWRLNRRYAVQGLINARKAQAAKAASSASN